MDGKFDRRNRPQREREIYRPGSGPLKRTDPTDSNRFCKFDFSNRPDNRDSKDDYDADKVPHESSSYSRYESHNENRSDKDRRKAKKPDASIYVPKQRSRVDGSTVNESQHFNSTSHAPPDNQKLSYASRDGLMTRENDFSAHSAHYDNNHHQSRVYVESKQFTRGYKNDNQSNWKEYSKENSDVKKNDPNRDTYDSQNQSTKSGYKNNASYEDRNTYYNSDLKSSNNYHRYGNEPFNDKYRNDRGNTNDKNRMGRSLSRRNSSNSISLPDAFISWAPRLQRQYLESKGIKQDDLDKYLKSRQQQQFVGNSNRDSRYSQTLPPKNNRNAHFKINNKENPRNARFFQKPKPFDERPGTDHSGSSEEKPKPLNASNSEQTITEKSWTVNDSARESSAFKNEPSQKNAAENESTEESQRDDSKDVIDNNDEDFNWAEEVEREQLYVEKNLCEADDFHRNDDNSSDKKKDRKKRRSFSFERKPTSRSRNPSENENQNRKKVEDDHRQNSRSMNEDNRADANDGYLSWRRNKNPSPTRTRLGIMGRNYRSDSKFDSFRNNSNDHEKISNKIKINNKINELPAIVREQSKF